MTIFYDIWPLWILSFFMFSASCLCCFDIWLYATNKKTISRFTINWLYTNPGYGFLAVAAVSGMMGWFLGALTGHLVWGQTIP